MDIIALARREILPANANKSALNNNCSAQMCWLYARVISACYFWQLYAAISIVGFARQCQIMRNLRFQKDWSIQCIRTDGSNFLYIESMDLSVCRCRSLWQAKDRSHPV